MISAFLFFFRILIVILILCGTSHAQLLRDGNGNKITSTTAGAKQALDVNIAAGAAGGTSSNFGAAFPSAGTAAGFKDTLGNMQGALLDASLNLKVNCAVGCAGGSSTPSDAFANPTTAGLQMGFNMGWNGTTWDRLEVDASKLLKVNCASGCSGAADTVGTTAALGALNATASVALAGDQGTGVLIASGTLAATVVPELSFDGGTTWIATFFYNPSTNALASSLVFTNPNAASTYSLLIAGGTSNARVRVSAYTSGTANATLRATSNQGSVPVMDFQGTSPWVVSGTVTANAGTGTFTVGQATGTNLHAVIDSGTLTANIGTTNGLALDASVTGLQVAQASTTSGQKGSLVLCAVTTSAPTYTTAQSDPCSLTTSGLLRVDGSGVTQPVSGTVTANAGTGTFTVGQATGTNLHTVIDSGTLTANIGTTNGLALDATVSKLNIGQGTALGTNTGPLMQGSVTTSAPTYTTGNINPLSLNTSGGLRVDGSGVTQPVSGTVTANAGTGIFTVGGTVTANAGTNLNTSLLQLDSTGAKLNLAQGSTTAGQTGPLILGAVTTGSPIYTTAQSDPISLDTSGNLRVNLTTALPAGTNVIGHVILDSGSLNANQSVNVAQINGVTPLMGNGTTGTGSHRVTVSSDNTAIANWGQGATGSAVPSGGLYLGGNGSGNLTGQIMCDKFQIQNALATLGNTQLVALSGTTKVYVCGFTVNGASTTLNTVKLVYGTGTACGTGQTDMSVQVPIQAPTSIAPAGQNVSPPSNVVWATTAGQALCVNLSAAQAVNVMVWYSQF